LTRITERSFSEGSSVKLGVWDAEMLANNLRNLKVDQEFKEICLGFW
jgi:hypothetical protein